MVLVIPLILGSNVGNAMQVEPIAKEYGCVDQATRIADSDMFTCTTRSGAKAFFRVPETRKPQFGKPSVPLTKPATRLLCRGYRNGGSDEKSGPQSDTIWYRFEVIFDDATQYVSVDDKSFGKIVTFNKFNIHARRFQVTPKLQTEYSIAIDRGTGRFEYRALTRVGGAQGSSEPLRTTPTAQDFVMQGSCSPVAAKF